MKTRVLSWTALLVVTAWVSPASAVIVSTHDHNGDGFASGTGADASITESSAAGNYGTTTALEIRNQTSTYQQVPYLRFDLSAIDKANAQRVRLQLYDYRFDGSGPLRGNKYGLWALNNEALDNWSEGNGGSDNNPPGEITWNTAPGHWPDGKAFDDADFNADATFLGEFTYTQHGSGPWSVPLEVPGLLERIKSDTNQQLTLMLVGPAGAGTLFRTGSKESTQTSYWTNTPIPRGSAAPRLLVDTTTTIVSTFDHDGDGLASGNGADTWIAERSPTSANGSAGYMCLRNQPAPDALSTRFQESVYLRFDLSAVDAAATVDAKLQLYDYRFDQPALMAGKEYSVWALADETQDNWSETALTWENAPGHSDDGLPYDDADFDAATTFLGSFTIGQESAANGWSLPIDVPGLAELVRNDTNGLVTLMITGPVGPNTLFYMASKETVFDRLAGTGQLAMPAGVLAPRLLLIVPEPSTAWLALVGVGMVLCRLCRIRGGACGTLIVGRTSAGAVGD